MHTAAIYIIATHFPQQKKSIPPQSRTTQYSPYYT